MRPYAILGDEQTWIARRFLASTWFGMGSNAEHCAQTRGRLAVSCDHLFQPICDQFGAFSGSVVVPVYSAGRETHYSALAIFAARQFPRDEYLLQLSLASDDTAGAHPSAAQPALDVQLSVLSPGLPWAGAAPALPVWPSVDGEQVILAEVASGVLDHACDADLPPGLRLLTLSWEWVDHKPDEAIWLRSLYIVGRTEEVA